MTGLAGKIRYQFLNVRDLLTNINSSEVVVVEASRTRLQFTILGETFFAKCDKKTSKITVLCGGIQCAMTGSALTDWLKRLVDTLLILKTSTGERFQEEDVCLGCNMPAAECTCRY